MKINKNSLLETLDEDVLKCFYFTTTKNSVYEWDNLCEQINNKIATLSVGFIWHKDAFRVHVPMFLDALDMPTCLHSITCFGDNIDDEWFIVYLVMEITKQFPNLIVQMIDNDGDFLLIESADYLPKWANPGTTENRVFIHNGIIHLIEPSDPDCQIKLEDAVNMISDKTVASVPIQDAIKKRIEGYPQKIIENIHTVNVKLPVDLAALLTLEPSLISPIISAYCNHDIIDIKSCKKVNLDSCVTLPVKFTKCLYAMLLHAKIIKKLSTNVTDKDKKSTLGMKLTWGFQIIMSKLSADMFSTKEYRQFLTNLKNNKYFREYLEGSVQYKQLLEKANSFFTEIECPVNMVTTKKVSDLMATSKYLEIKDMLLNSNMAKIDDDDDSWLNISPEQLNNLLRSKYGKSSSFKSNEVITADNLSSELSNFLTQKSDFEGIEPSKRDTIDAEEIEFDPDDFVKNLEKMLNLVTSDPDIEHTDSEFSDLDDMEEPESSDFHNEKVLSFDLENSNQPATSILKNLTQSMKEEQGSSGPSSNLLHTVGFNKADLLDSDDDEE